jgi:hypothetical protein
MGREVRRVSKHWQHPRDENGKYIPLYGRCYEDDLKDWMDMKKAWDNGFMKKYGADEDGLEPRIDNYLNTTFADYYGECPEKLNYMPSWKEEERTHLMMYEDTTEGTPISPACETAEELARWLADNNASAFGKMTATYEEWLATIKRGYAFGLVLGQDGMRSCVAYNKELEAEKS